MHSSTSFFKAFSVSDAYPLQVYFYWHLGNMFIPKRMMTSWYGNALLINGPLCVDSPYKGPVILGFDVSLLLAKQAVEQTVELQVILDGLTRMSGQHQ